MKIVITGGLGYIGSELCKLYSGEARFKNIVVVDKRFAAERVKQLRDWGIDYINASIMDADRMKEILSDADVVFHLAGITDVAYVKTQSNPEHDKEIRETGIIGTQNIINAVSDTCKIIFPSTHVVYEGFTETRTGITEDVPPCPVLTYATGKAQSEADLAASNKNYVVLRLASVYGYSTDTMRIGIMPNLFSKIAAENGTIKLFSAGVQLKSLVPIFDVVRCMKFMAEQNHINREIFHLSLEQKSVREVAELCKKINPKVNLVSTNDEIPNLGYTISNQKLLNTGFKFLYNLETCLREMITNWSVKDINPALEYIDRGGDGFVDDRGSILNYKLTEPINLIGLIKSYRGSVRANHYHPVQEQKCLLVSGQYISVTKDLSVPNAPIETRVINSGDIAIIKPNVAHAMVFTENSVFLNLVRGEREHANYGITHTIPYKLVDDTLRDLLLKNYLKDTCRVCDSKELNKVVSLGMSPLANNLIDNPNDSCEQYPLEMDYCPKCHNCQLSVVVPPDKMFKNYLYVSSTNETFRQHFKDAANKFISEYGLNNESLVIDIGSNDGIFLKPLHEAGVRVIGFEPATDIARKANEDGIHTICRYFDYNAADDLLRVMGHKADLVTAFNVFAHSDKLKDMLTGVFTRLLKPNGRFIIEVQYLKDTIKDLTFDNIYHEHVNYWSVLSLRNFAIENHIALLKVEHVNTHGGSIRAYFGNKDQPVDASVQEFIDEEIKFGMDKYETYVQFGKNVENVKNTVCRNFEKLKAENPNIIAYGSPAKATTALNYFGIDCNSIKCTIEDNSLKHGKLIPGVNIPITSKSQIDLTTPHTIIVLAWNFFDSIVKNNQDLVKAGHKFVNIKDLEK